MIRRIGDWISDRMNDSRLVRLIVVPIVWAYTIQLVCLASIFQRRTSQKRLTNGSE